MFYHKGYKPHNYKKASANPPVDVQRFERIMNDRDCSGVSPYNKPDGFYELNGEKKSYLTTGKTKGSE